MTVTRQRNFTGHNLFLFMLTTITGCGGGTMDFVGNDHQTFVGSVESKRKLSERATIDISYLITAGSNRQYPNTGIQANGIRYNQPTYLDNTYTYQALSSHYEHTIFPNSLIQITIAPGLQAHYLTLSSKSDFLNKQITQLRPAYGLKLGASFNFSDRTRALVGLAFYDQKADYYYANAGIWLEHTLHNAIGLKLGLSGHETGDGVLYSSDRCYSDQSLAENCENSDVEIHSRGLHIGLTYNQAPANK